MSKEIEVKVTTENKELIVLTGAAEAVYHQKSISVENGSINSVVEYLNKKIVDGELIQNSKVEYCYDELFINLDYAARERNPDIIKGSLKLHPDLLKFNINTGKSYDTFGLADFIKMNRHYFENKEYAMKLVGLLRGFEGKVKMDIEAKMDGRGNNKALINQVVESNIPESFIVLLPVFIGQPVVRLEVEINITASFECTLISPDLKELIDLESKNILDGELAKIRQLHPELKVFEV